MTHHSCRLLVSVTHANSTIIPTVLHHNIFCILNVFNKIHKEGICYKIVTFIIFSLHLAGNLVTGNAYEKIYKKLYTIPITVFYLEQWFSNFPVHDPKS
jgi:hypothetical protein